MRRAIRDYLELRLRYQRVAGLPHSIAWASTNPEVLAVHYFRPKNQTISSEAALSAAAAAVVPGKKSKPASTKHDVSAGGNRHYLGYIVRIYYSDKLQAQKAQPTQLLSIFPAPASSQ